VKQKKLAIFAAAVSVGVLAMGQAYAAPDWSKAQPRKVTLFYPGQASYEWVMNVNDHSSATDMTKKRRTCAKCHDSDASEIGDKVVKGEAVGSSKSVIEPKPVAGKKGFVPATVQIAHDGSKIYFRYEWTSPKAVSEPKMDSKNETKLTMMFDGGGTVEDAEINGCWGTCHNDLRSMKSPKDDKKTKYVKDGNVATGKYMDLMQWRKGEKSVDGYVDTERHMDGGQSLIKADGKKTGSKWVVTFERELAGKGKGDHSIVAGKTYNFGFAVHENFAGARFHYVSLGYQFGLDKDNKEVKNYINVQKQ